MKKIFSVLVGMLVATAIMAQEPVITFEKTTHDFGKINEADGRVTTVFTFKNEGMSPLVLSNVRASCGCTTPKWTKEPIEPGATGSINVTYNPNGRPGKFQKTITVSSNAKEATMRLYIKGEVIPKPAKPVEKYPVKIGELCLTTKNISLGDVLKGKTVSHSIEYANQTDDDVTVEVSQQPYLAADVTLPVIKKGESGKIVINFDAAACPTYGPVKKVIYLKINGKAYENEMSAINVTANVQEDFSNMTAEQQALAPIAEINNKIDLGILPANKTKVTKVLPLTNVGGNPLLIRRVIAADDMTFLAPKTGLKTGKKALKVVVNTTRMASTKYQRDVTIITNDPKNPIRTVKFVWEVQ